jgi:diaminohydroxyphosphoribosylaminopyrimidine deaminase/5-amino-6-(5-phosphoribosylamino)uracil reductase
VASAAEVAAMRRAIALSAAGLGTTSANPPVGCVLIGRDGDLVGEGYHERKGESHAEALALAAAGSAAGGSTAIVTLEPCNHQGRTPPCRQALIDAGVRRVVIAVTDPTSRGAGGTAELRKVGIDVETGVLENEARLVLGSWLTATTTGRPHVTWPYVLTGGAVTALPHSSAEARTLELAADAVLHADGQVAEAVPGSHGQDVLSLPAWADADPHHDLASLFAGGARRLLLSGGLTLASRFLAVGLVDRVVALLADGAASRQPDRAMPWALVPSGFVITAVARIPGFVRVDADRRNDE